MQLFELIKVWAFIIIIFYILLKSLQYCSNITIFEENGDNISSILFFAVFSTLGIVFIKLTGILNNNYIIGIFVIASGYYLGPGKGFITAMISSFIISTIGLTSGFGTAVCLGTEGLLSGVITKKIDGKLKFFQKIIICCTICAALKFILSAALFRYGMSNSFYMCISDFTGSVIVITIINEYIMEKWYIKENKKLSYELSLLRLQNRKLNNIFKTNHKFYRFKCNPEKIFNTLDILMELLKKDTFKAKELISNYKIYIEGIYKHCGSVLKFDDGIKILNAYIKIVQIKYYEKVKICLSVKGDMTDCYLPIMILEPIIENSIIHGIYPKATGGMIFINIEIINEKINIIIEDTGIGIDTEHIGHLFDNKKSLYNIYRRLNIIYRKNCSIDVRSNIEDGTTVAIQIPGKINGFYGSTKIEY